ncbi:MAG: branched-chain amino acid ABC transporter permease [Halobacteriota archaeon]
MSDTAGDGMFADLSRRSQDLLLVFGALIGIYALFAVAVLGQGINSVVANLRVLTFFILAYGMLALALNLHWGYTGLFNIGVAGFMAVGVYTMAMLSGDPGGSPPGLGLPLPIGVLGGMAAAAVIGLLVALPALKLRADYLAIVTLGFSEIIRLTYNSEAFNQWVIGASSTVTSSVGFLPDSGFGTGAGSGIQVPSPSSPTRNLLFEGGRVGNPTPLGEAIFAVTDPIGIQPNVVVEWIYVIVLAVILIGFYVLLSRIGNSPFGRVLKSIREDDLVASSLGKHVEIFKIKVFMVGCALMGLAGILWQGSYGFVSPNDFMPVVTFYIFVAVIIGGAGSNTGSVIGSILFVGLLFEGPRRALGAVGNRLDYGTAPNSFVDAVGPILSGEFAPFLAYSIDNRSALVFVLLGVVLVAIIQIRPDGVLGGRNEPAAAVDLSQRTHPREPTAADGGERHE